MSAKYRCCPLIYLSKFPFGRQLELKTYEEKEFEEHLPTSTNRVLRSSFPLEYLELTRTKEFDTFPKIFAEQNHSYLLGPCAFDEQISRSRSSWWIEPFPYTHCVQTLPLSS